MDGYRPMVINVALTGAVPHKSDNRLVPLSPEEIVADVLKCADAGATAFHVHVRDENGTPVHRRDLYEATFGAIRAARPELVLCVTTSSRVDADPAARMAGLDLDEAIRPDMASLTLGSFNFPNQPSVNPPDQMVALLETMAELGIRPELEVFELGMINTMHLLAERGLIPSPPVVNVLLGSMGSMPAFVGDLAQAVERLGPGVEWAAAGIGRFQNSMVLAAAIMDGNVRTGLAETRGGDYSSDWSNCGAVERGGAAETMVSAGVATAAETRERFGLRAVG